MTARPITAAITTRNRPEALARCVRSLAAAEPFLESVTVFDDASDRPVAEWLGAAAPPPIAARLTVIRAEAQVGTAAGKNRIAHACSSPFLLGLDDDAFLLDAAPIHRGLEILRADPAVAAVGFAQADASGVAWPAAMQPSRSAVPARVAAFSGYGCLLRRDVLLGLGGYRDRFIINGEEREYCLRLLDAGFGVVYLPDALVGHVADPAGRNATRTIRLLTRNGCLAAIYNEPLPLALATIAVHLWRHRRMARRSGGDAGGYRWLIAELRKELPGAWRQRRPLAWRTLVRWRQLRRAPAYRAPASARTATSAGARPGVIRETCGR